MRRVKKRKRYDFKPASMEKKSNGTMFGDIMLKIWSSKMALTNVNRVHWNLSAIALNASMLIFFVQIPIYGEYCT